MFVRNYVTVGLNVEELGGRRESGLKAQKHLAQGIALGLVSEFVRPVRAKALI